VAEERGLWDLYHVGLLEIEAVHHTSDGKVASVLFRATEKGVELLRATPDKRIASICSDFVAIVLQCVPQLELEDLPEFLTSVFSDVREAAWARSQELLKQRKRGRIWRFLSDLFRRGAKSWMDGK